MNKVKIWVDADACPRVIKDILYRAAERMAMELLLIANQPLQVPRSAYIRAIQVPAGFDVADNYIAAHAVSGDLLVSADIPLAAEVIGKGVTVLSPRGEHYDEVNIRERLSMRDFMTELRSSGVETGGQAVFNQSDRQRFANQLDRWLSHLAR